MRHTSISYVQMSPATTLVESRTYNVRKANSQCHHVLVTFIKERLTFHVLLLLFSLFRVTLRQENVHCLLASAGLQPT